MKGDDSMCYSRRFKLIKKVVRVVNSSDPILIGDIKPHNYGRTSNARKGIYFLFNSEGKIIYIGMISDKNGTSLYNRCINGHSEPHITKLWGLEIDYVKFSRFDTLTDDEIEQVEAMLIYKLNPIHNHATARKEDIKSILKKL